MPRPKKPTRLALKTYRDGSRRWIIRHEAGEHRTGIAERETRAATRALAEFIAEQGEPQTIERGSDQVDIERILTVYMEAKESIVARPDDLHSRTEFLLDFWGRTAPDQINGATCRKYAESRSSAAAARRELEDLRAAINYYAREHGLATVPAVTLPDKPLPRERWLTRSEAARLLRAAARQRWAWPDRVDHLARFILIEIYTGTRSGATLALNWNQGPDGGWPDLDAGILYRRGERTRETTKRRPPAKLGRRILAHLKRWKRIDGGRGPIIHDSAGQPIVSVRRSFGSAVEAAGLGWYEGEGKDRKFVTDVTPHTLRHTRATWLMQAGVKPWIAAGSLGMTVDTLERVYGHHHPDFQAAAADAY